MKLVYPGSFDPITRGHLDLIARASRLAGEVVVAIGTHLSKRTLFTVAERRAFIERAVREAGLSNVRVEEFDGLAVELVRALGFDGLLRGIRTPSDFEYELAMALTNRSLANEVETLFMTPSQEYCFTSSSLLKEAARMGAALGRFLTPDVEAALKVRLRERG